MKPTVCASLSTMISLPAGARYPSGGTPPIHIPFFFEAATRSAACRRPHHQRCGTGIWPDRDITAFRPDVPAPRVSLPTQAAGPGPDNRGKPRLLDLERRIPARDRFAPDSPLEEAVRSELWPVSGNQIGVSGKFSARSGKGARLRVSPKGIGKQKVDQGR